LNCEGRAFIFSAMKRILLLVLLAFGLVHTPLFAQDSTTAAAIADKQAAEERYRRMAADVESLLAANLALQKKISALDAELQRVREEQARSANNSNTTESLRKLAEAIQEVDRKREADKQKILDEVQKIVGKALTTAPVRTNPRPVAPEPSTGPQKGYTHVVKEGDVLGLIVSDYNAAFKKEGIKTISQKQVMDANPDVNWNRLQIGQKIFIPAPE
jgi:TolA-binding protein